MDLSEMVDRVDRIVDDDDFDEDEITKYLNRGILQVAGGIRRADSSVLTQPLPLLFKIGTVSTGSGNTVALPVDYQRDLVFAMDSVGRELPIYDSFIKYMETYRNLTMPGILNGLAVKGRTLYYQFGPATPELITIHYHRYPVEMTQDTDVPDGIPSEFHESVVVNYALKEIYTIKEDGIDGNPLNTMKYEKRFQLGIDTLEAHIASDASTFSFFA